MRLHKRDRGNYDSRVVFFFSFQGTRNLRELQDVPVNKLQIERLYSDVRVMSPVRKPWLVSKDCESWCDQHGRLMSINQQPLRHCTLIPHKERQLYTGNAIPFTGSWDRTVPIHMHLINGVLDIELFRYGTRGLCRSDQRFMFESEWAGKKNSWKYQLKLCYTWKICYVNLLCLEEEMPSHISFSSVWLHEFGLFCISFSFRWK